MLGLRQAWRVRYNTEMKGGWVYILTNRPHGTLYVGVTSDVQRRAWQHREGGGSDFVDRYGLHRLVYAEAHDLILAAIAREKALKRWPRAWKVRLIELHNPDWSNLCDTLT
jgi:putative endonuclease